MEEPRFNVFPPKSQKRIVPLPNGLMPGQIDIAKTT